MSHRKNIVAGNWKMNKNYEEGRTLAREIVAKLKPSETLAILGAPYIHLKGVSHIISDINNLHLAAQNCHQEEGGAYTGEISTGMLRSVGCDYVILGHSERRDYFEESNQLINAKVKKTLADGMLPIFCCGEKLPVREAGDHEKLVAQQVKEGLFDLSATDFSKVVIAYEPVWAIGTGVTASPDQAQEMHAFIRSLVVDQYGEEVADATSILYGGSVKPGNAKELFSQPDVDGGLVGGASLNAADFLAIMDAM
ncbi:triose-phosphate isomerase [Lewinella cohaerens]|uniref:triose-phosphate isomerase n=1 Tax=Lewinella cohaerens TaxID=70995 RepID=UPI00037171DE|nr:triose-phosphate isomerase [Lewinella cohaerens]